MRGVKREFPLHIVCKRDGCENLREVRCPAYQARGGYCSQRCNALDHQNIRKAGLTGVRNSVTARRQRLLARLDGLSNTECFRLGYKVGLYSKLRQVRRKFKLVKKVEAA